MAEVASGTKAFDGDAGGDVTPAAAKSASAWPQEVPGSIGRRSDGGNGCAPSPLVAARLRLEGQIGSTPHRAGQSMLSISCISQDSGGGNASLVAMRRRLDGLEDKMEGHLVQLQRCGDIVRDAAWARVDAKMSSIEASQPRLDKKVAELSGQCQALSEDVHAILHRLDEFDAKLVGWRDTIDEGLQLKLSDMDRARQQISGAIKGTNSMVEGVLKTLHGRVQRLETLLQEHVGPESEINVNLAQMHTRLQEVETSRIQDLTLLSKASTSPPPSPRTREVADEAAVALRTSVASLETNLSEALLNLDNRSTDLEDLRTRVEAQEERLRSMRTLLEGKEEQLRSERLGRQDAEARAGELRGALQRMEVQRSEHAEQLEVMHRCLEDHQAKYEELGERLRSSSSRVDRSLSSTALLSSSAGALLEQPAEVTMALQLQRPSGLDATGALVPVDDEVVARLESAEAQLEALGSEVARFGEVGPRISSFVQLLQQVAPKINVHEGSLRELTEKVAVLEVRSTSSSSSASAFTKSSAECAIEATSEASTEAAVRAAVEAAEAVVDRAMVKVQAAVAEAQAAAASVEAGAVAAAESAPELGEHPRGEALAGRVDRLEQAVRGLLGSEQDSDGLVAGVAVDGSGSGKRSLVSGMSGEGGDAVAEVRPTNNAIEAVEAAVRAAESAAQRILEERSATWLESASKAGVEAAEAAAERAVEARSATWLESASKAGVEAAQAAAERAIEERSATWLESASKASVGAAEAAAERAIEERSATWLESASKAGVGAAEAAAERAIEERSAALLESASKAGVGAAESAAERCVEERSAALLESASKAGVGAAEAAAERCVEERSAALLESASKAGVGAAEAAAERCVEERLAALLESASKAGVGAAEAAAERCVEERSAALLESASKAGVSAAEAAVEAAAERSVEARLGHVIEAATKAATEALEAQSSTALEHAAEFAEAAAERGMQVVAKSAEAAAVAALAPVAKPLEERMARLEQAVHVLLDVGGNADGSSEDRGPE